MRRSTGSRPAPAWYADPRQHDQLRYWNGKRWTDQYRPYPGWAASSVRRIDQHLPPVSGRHRRFAMHALLCAALVSALAAGALMSAQPSEADRLHDRGLRDAAAAACAVELRALRSAPPMVKPDAARAEMVASALDKLTKRLVALPVPGDDRAVFERWTDSWRAYAEGGYHYAEAVRNGDQAGQQRLQAGAEPTRRRLDEVSRANNLLTCAV